MSERGYGSSPQSPAADGAVVVPDDSNDLPKNARALYVGSSGDLVVQFAGGAQNTVLFSAVASGTLLPFTVKRVLSSGTTASAIVALFE